MNIITKYFVILTPETVTADAVEIWADRVMGDFERKVGKNAPSKQKAGLRKMFHPTKGRLKFYISTVYVDQIKSCQKLAQRDQAAMVELLQICCLMESVWNQIQSYLGQGKLVDGIMDQWGMGMLGLQLCILISKPCIFGLWSISKPCTFGVWCLAT